jgi:hypothetical protein
MWSITTGNGSSQPRRDVRQHLAVGPQLGVQAGVGERRCEGEQVVE